MISYRPRAQRPRRRNGTSAPEDELLDSTLAGAASGRRPAWHETCLAWMPCPLGYDKLMSTLWKPELPDSDEWVLTFASYTTDLPAGAETFASELTFAYPGWHDHRTVVQGLVAVPAVGVVAAELKGFASYNLVLNGEVLRLSPPAPATERDDKLFDSFRVRFDFPAAAAGEVLPLVFERYLRPGTYRVIVRVQLRPHRRTKELPAVLRCVRLRG